MRVLMILLVGPLLALTGCAGEPVLSIGDRSQEILVLGDYTPAPRIMARADSLRALAAATKPTLICDGEMLWIKYDKQGNPSFVFGSPCRVQLGKGPAFWALLRPGESNQAESMDGMCSTDISNASMRALACVEQKPGSDHGAGDYVSLILHRGEYDLYEIGIQRVWLGTGHPVEERRLYVLRGPGGVWRFVGEGPGESAGKAGVVSYWTETTAKAQLTGNPDAPVSIEFQTISAQMVADEIADALYPELDICRESLLSGALPAHLQNLTDFYTTADTSVTALDDIITRYIYWEISGASETPADPSKAAAARKLIQGINPSLIHCRLSAGEIIYLPTSQESYRINYP